LAKVFKPGDFRSGYYRDQTFMFAIGALTIEQWFAGLYAHTDLNFEPTSGGRQMGGHYATHLLNADGSWKNLVELKNSSADVSPTGSQMPRLLGLAYASYFYRNNPHLQQGEFLKFSNKGNEIAFGTIGDASTSEGLFWETLNAAGVLQVPMIVSVWDDGHGISVPKKYQTIKESISEALKGFQRTKTSPGFEILYTKGWDYVHLIETYEKAEYIARNEHVPVLIHVDEVTQPQGHSTSGSHERYKSKERLQWEAEFDGIKKMREWLLANGFATENELNDIEEEAKQKVLNAKNKAWENYLSPILEERKLVAEWLDAITEQSSFKEEIQAIKKELLSIKEPIRKDIHQAAKKVLRLTKLENSEPRKKLSQWIIEKTEESKKIYGSDLYSETERVVLLVHSILFQNTSQIHIFF
jgi:TPP-dependent pyruvate/acetoin dehydrogenase alpha subunit